MSEIDEHVLVEATTHVLSTNFEDITSLSKEQERALGAFLSRKDTFVVLPTGFGKSLIFQMVPAMCKYLCSRGYSYPIKEAILIVVCPLNSVIESHLTELEAGNIPAAKLSGEEVDQRGILEGKYSIVFANPEPLMRNEKWRSMLRSEVYQQNLFGIVTDEAHVIPKWGQDNTKEKIVAFRECFGRLGELRSLAPKDPEMPVLALIATATKEIRKDIIKSLGLRKDKVEITVSPNRSNIYLYVAKVSNKISESFGWLIEQVRKEGVTIPQTIVYCRTTKDCGRLFKYFQYCLGGDAYYPCGAEHLSQNCLIAQFCHSTLQKHKDRITDSFQINGTCRLAFSTNALGMGVNFKQVRTVIHYGPPRHIEDFVQEIGRAGRDKQPAISLLLYSGPQLKNCDKQMKAYTESKNSCLRKLLLEQFKDDTEPLESVSLHKCCIVCHHKCDCTDSWQCSIPLPEYGIDNSCSDMAAEAAAVKVRSVTQDQKTLLRELLCDYQSSLRSDGAYLFNAETSTGFTDSLITATVQKCKYIFDLDFIVCNLPIFKFEHAIEILYMVKDVFEDLDDKVFPKGIELKKDLEFELDFECGGVYDWESSGDECDYSFDSEMSGVDCFE